MIYDSIICNNNKNFSFKFFGVRYESSTRLVRVCHMYSFIHYILFEVITSITFQLFFFFFIESINVSFLTTYINVIFGFPLPFPFL